MWVQDQGFEPQRLARFAELQRKVYAVLESVAATLRDGDAERDVAARVRHALKALGACSWFHVPVALFGERSAYPGEFGALEALPTDRPLADGDMVILDAAPILEGHLIDCSLAVPRSGVDVQAFERCDAVLAELRGLILERARAQSNMRNVAQEVDRVIKARGLRNCHRLHIGAVLAHRATFTPASWLAQRCIWGLSPAPVAWFFARSARANRGRPEATPNWNHTRQCNTPLQPGLWCVEPHVALGDVGVKFEEMLLVDEHGARWLDDDLPHVRRWRQRG
jgi:Xaa-Pro aminopeptidase